MLGPVGDAYELEAEHIAEQLTREPRHSLARAHAAGRPGDSVPESSSELETHLSGLRGGGQPLPEPLRAEFEPRFGHDFSQVRVHTSARAAASARALSARAFTLGEDIVFAEGQFSPGSEAGRRLLAHELTHVVQQSGTARGSSGTQRVQRQQAPAAPAAQPRAAPRYRIIHGPRFVDNLEGVPLKAELLAAVTRLCNHLIQNHLVRGNITFNDGVRSPARAHLWSTAWSIQHDRVPMANLRALPEGKDQDGNLWYQPKDTLEQVKARAARYWSGAQAAEGYPRGDARRNPNTYRTVSNHCMGNALDASIPWATEGGPFGEIANGLVSQFGLRRPVAREAWHFEL